MAMALTAAQKHQAGRGRNRNSRSPFKGITWHRGIFRWHASIMFRQVRIYLGIYDSPVEAAIAYDAAARHLFGKYARLNFPHGGK